MRKAKATGAPGTLPGDATLREWFLLPFAAPMRREANAGVPIVIPKGGKRVLAQIAWPGDGERQARFVKAGSRNPQGLSREEYLQLANTDSFWGNNELIHDLLQAWAIRAVRAAAKSEPVLATQPERLLNQIFREELVEFVLGRPLTSYREGIAGSEEPQEIVRRYLLSESWKQMVELVTLEGQRRAGGRKGTDSWIRRRNFVHDQIRAAAEKIHPALRVSEAIEQIRQAPVLVDKKGKPPSVSTVRRALAKSKGLA